jgi:hypothetical protein
MGNESAANNKYLVVLIWNSAMGRSISIPTLAVLIFFVHSSLADARLNRKLLGFGVIGSAGNSSGTGGNDGSGGSVSVDGTTPPTASPTELSGVVVLPDVPAAAPAFGTNDSPSNGWSAIVFSYSLEFYTGSINQVQIAVASVNNQVTTSLRGFVNQQNVSVNIRSLSDEQRGSCNSTKNSELPFPAFPVCNVIETKISTEINISEHETSVVYESLVQHIRNTFIPTYNKNSTHAKLVFLAPIEVSANLNISMFGVETMMNTDESAFFVDTLQTGLLGLFLNGTESNRIITMNLGGVEILHQVSSSGNRLLLADSNETKKVLAREKYFNYVVVLITASCSGNQNCTDESLQRFLDGNAPSYGFSMLTALVLDPNLFYFDDLIDLQIGKRDPPELPPSEVPPNSTQEVVETDKMPLWLVALIVVNVVIVTSVIFYVCVRQGIRYKQGDKLKDVPQEEMTGQQRMSFVPAPAPTFQQLQELNSREMIHDTNVFSKRGQNKAPPPQEYDDDDDNRSCDDQFSVEAGSFGGDGYDANQWNNSYNDYT